VVASIVLNADVTAITDMFNIVIHKMINCIVYADGVGEQAAGSQPSTSIAAWADEATAPVREILPQESGDGTEDDDFSSTPELTETKEEEEPVAAARAVSTLVPSKLATWKDSRGGPVVDP